MNEIVAQLERLRTRSRWLLVGQRLAVLVAWLVGTALALALADYLLHLPRLVRLVLLAAGLMSLGWSVRRYLWPAVMFAPSLVQLALRVEGRIPALSGRLASCVEFARSGVVLTNALAQRSVREAQRRMAGQSVMTVIDARRAWTGIAAALGVTVITVAVWLACPAMAGVGAKRILLPLGATNWPSRTGVISLMHEVAGDHMVFPRQRVLTLRAQVTKGPPDQRVTARYRLMRDESFGRWRSVVLTHQVHGRHERLIEAGADAIQLQFVTEDARTDLERIEMIAPPEVLAAELTVVPPVYASERVPVLRTDLGSGTDDRSVTSTASLVGSDVTLELQLNKPLPPPPTEDPKLAEWIRRTFNWRSEALPAFEAAPSSRSRWTLKWQLARTESLAITLADEHEISNNEPISYRIEAIEDREPDVGITEPEQDESILPTAIIELAAEAHDDVALRVLGLEAWVALEGESDMAEAAPAWTQQRQAGAATATISAVLDLVDLSAGEGDEVLVHAVAQDDFTRDGAARPAVRSSPRRFRVISRSEMADTLRGRLATVRQNAIRIEATQQQLQGEFAADRVVEGLQQAQARIGRRIAEQGDAVESITAQLRRNRLDDSMLADLLGQSGNLLVQASGAADRAAQAAGGRPDDSLPDPVVNEIVGLQQEVRDELASLVSLLDSDEDAWVAIRGVEELLRRQTELQEQTGKLGARSLGRSRDELEAEVRSDLDDSAGRQDELAGESRVVIDELRARADVLAKSDSRTAAGLRKAADTADQRRLKTDMASAAGQIRQNQISLASESQQAAVQTLQRMLQNIAEADDARVDELLRRLASLVESIIQLIDTQEQELAALRAGKIRQSFEGRDAAMIQLRRNTASVTDQARDVEPSTRRIVTRLTRAGDAQDDAIQALRAEPTDVEGAEASEEESLRLLREARELAEELRQQVQAQQQRKQRQELIEGYRDLARREDSLRLDTEPLIEMSRLDRRALREARRCAGRQEEIRVDVLGLQDDTEELADTVVFLHVHRMIDDWARLIGESLNEGAPTGETGRRQQMIVDNLIRLVEALEELESEPPEFAQPGGGEGGGGGGGVPPLIPPVAELKLLRGLQEQIYNETRAIDSSDDLDDATRRARLIEIGRRQRELIEISRIALERMGETAPSSDDGGGR